MDGSNLENLCVFSWRASATLRLQGIAYGEAADHTFPSRRPSGVIGWWLESECLVPPLLPVGRDRK